MVGTLVQGMPVEDCLGGGNVDVSWVGINPDSHYARCVAGGLLERNMSVCHEEPAPAEDGAGAEVRDADVGHSTDAVGHGLSLDADNTAFVNSFNDTFTASCTNVAFSCGVYCNLTTGPQTRDTVPEPKAPAANTDPDHNVSTQKFDQFNM